MNNFTTYLLQNLLSNKDSAPALEDMLQEAFRLELEKAVNEVLKIELDIFLDYHLYERSENTDSRNGFSKKDFNTRYGTIHLNIPRDRFGFFHNSLIPKYARNSESVEDTIVNLYKLGITGSDITKIVNDIYGKQYSKSTVSRISSSISTNVEAFKKRALQKEYAVIYLDGTMMPLKRDTVAKECVYIALGITPEGNKEILSYFIAPTESVTNWKEILKDLQDRGVKQVSLFCTDGLHGMKDAIEETFPRSKIQRCLLHVQRNINSKVRVKDRTEISEDFKKVYTAISKELANEALAQFCEKWNKKYPKITESLNSNENLLTFYDYPKCVRASLYTTNMIESYNKQFKRKFKLKEQFPNEDSMERYLVCQFEEYNSKFMNRIHKGFAKTTRSDWFDE